MNAYTNGIPKNEMYVYCKLGIFKISFIVVVNNRFSASCPK